MRYQLVLQFQGDSARDLDDLLKLEERLIDAVGVSAEVDGHDIGSGEANIFILTPSPEATFARVKPVLQAHNLLRVVDAAYRPLTGENYIRVWPEHSSKQFTAA